MISNQRAYNFPDYTKIHVSASLLLPFHFSEAHKHWTKEQELSQIVQFMARARALFLRQICKFINNFVWWFIFLFAASCSVPFIRRQFEFGLKINEPVASGTFPPATDLAEIFMNILVTHKISFYFHWANWEWGKIYKKKRKKRESIQRWRRKLLTQSVRWFLSHRQSFVRSNWFVCLPSHFIVRM